ncbi:MAG: hypothetical protein Q9217_004328 [Psora testacea]
MKRNQILKKQEEGNDFFSCLGYLEEPDLSRYAFLFKIPQELCLEEAAQLISIDSYIDTFGSRNIVLVPKGYGSAKTVSQKNFQEYVAYLKCFGFARLKTGKSSGEADFDPDANLYRHPDRQGEPEKVFNKEHDLYAIGVVLTEIGFWTTAPSLKGVRGHMDSVRKREGDLDPKEITGQLLSLVRKYLPPVMGTKYAEAVEKCLCGFGILEEDKQQRNLGLAFYHQLRRIFEAGVKLMKSISGLDPAAVAQ